MKSNSLSDLSAPSKDKKPTKAKKADSLDESDEQSAEEKEKAFRGMIEDSINGYSLEKASREGSAQASAIASSNELSSPSQKSIAQPNVQVVSASSKSSLSAEEHEKTHAVEASSINTS